MITEASIVFLGMAVMTMIAFNLSNSLRGAINRGETVRNVAKLFCSGFCILVASLFLITHLDLSYGAPKTLIFFFHGFIITFQMAMIWFPPPK